MWNIKEEDLDKFRMICKHRWSHEDALGFMIGTIREHNETKNA
ncbi:MULTISPECIES: hypothetical protein [Bacillus cereus group]|nr:MULTISPECIES: hypothetical protein [Bacillus cereus group]MEB8931058.1 hypothetical protein [Bacillus cereus]MEB9324998.1 hypothetical protein [Bacillus cereus]MEB9912951.1 hypothetical protein [Bacillus cereus]MEC3213423.1 hypothetical protein [Bacillus cereus]MEC3244589.1 hypothetical protein [Bacillus cereus]